MNWYKLQSGTAVAWGTPLSPSSVLSTDQTSSFTPVLQFGSSLMTSEVRTYWFLLSSVNSTHICIFWRYFYQCRWKLTSNRLDEKDRCIGYAQIDNNSSQCETPPSLLVPAAAMTSICLCRSEIWFEKLGWDTTSEMSSNFLKPDEIVLRADTNGDRKSKL